MNDVDQGWAALKRALPGQADQLDEWRAQGVTPDQIATDEWDGDSVGDNYPRSGR